MDRKCCVRARKPSHVSRIAEVLLISCTELEELPSWTVRRHLGTFTVLRSPAALLDPEQSSQTRLLREMLAENPAIKQIVVCAHTLCGQLSKMKSPRGQEGASQKSSQACENNVCQLKTAASIQEECLSRNQDKIRNWLKELGRGEIELHTWIYEPESQWITTLDSETDIFVPLNACARLNSMQPISEL